MPTNCTRSPFSGTGVGEATRTLMSAPSPLPSAAGFGIEVIGSGEYRGAPERQSRDRRQDEKSRARRSKQRRQAARRPGKSGGVIFEELLVVSDETPHAAALNMALDEVLLRAVSVPTLRLYRWASRAVSFGYFGRWPEVLQRLAGARAGAALDGRGNGAARRGFHVQPDRAAGASARATHGGGVVPADPRGGGRGARRSPRCSRSRRRTPARLGVFRESRDQRRPDRRAESCRRRAAAHERGFAASGERATRRARRWSGRLSRSG